MGTVSGKLTGVIVAKSSQSKADAAAGAKSSLRMPHSSTDSAIASLDAIVGSTVAPGAGGAANGEEDLFALPMSPRSPEMKRSPFSLL